MIPAGQDSTPVLLFTNGEYCAHVNVPPSEMDVAAHKREFPSQVGQVAQARRKGRTAHPRRDLGEGQLGGTLRRARPGEEIDGSYHSNAGSGIGYIMNYSDITFLPGKRFRTTALMSASYGVGVPGSASASVTGPRRRDEGTYRLDGDFIELRHQDGTVERRSFFWAGTGRRMIFLNASFFYE